jgi:hypothetical protein
LNGGSLRSPDPLPKYILDITPRILANPGLVLSILRVAVDAKMRPGFCVKSGTSTFVRVFPFLASVNLIHIRLNAAT